MIDKLAEFFQKAGNLLPALLAFLMWIVYEVTR